MLLAFTAGGGLTLWFVGSPNPFMLGALIVAIGLTLAEVQWSSVPTPLVNAAQVLLGCNLGSRFERAETVAVEAQQATAFTHIVYTPSPRNEARVVGWLQRTSTPLESRLAFGQPATRSVSMGSSASSPMTRRW